MSKSTTLKYLVIGDSGVGKTSMLVRYCQDSFQTDFLSTIGVDFKIKRIQIDGYSIALNIWDTAGQQRFRNITKSFYKGAHGIVITYSITDPASYAHVQSWVQQIRQSGNAQTNIILVASKCDLQSQRKVSQKQGQQLAQKFNMKFLQTSAKDNNNIAKAFQILTREVIQRIGNQTADTGELTQVLGKQSKQKQKKNECCN